MGFFTFTRADREPERLKSGRWSAASLIRYGKYAALIAPDGTEYATDAYDGYGRFGRQADLDAFALAAEWNRDFLPGILEGLPADPGWTPLHEAVAKAYAGHDDAALEKALDEACAIDPIMRKRWKRIIGIRIADGARNADLPYPIKAVASKRHPPYADLRPSITAQ